MGLRILVTNDDGWDAEGLAVLKRVAAQLGEVVVVAPRDPHSYAGHRVTEDSALHLVESASSEFSLSGTPADCVRVGLTVLFEDIDWVVAGVNRGGNLGSDLFTSGTVAAAREAAFLGRPAIAISQYIQKGRALDWKRSEELALPVLEQLLARPVAKSKEYWNVNLPHTSNGDSAEIVFCHPDNQPLDVRFHRDGDHLRFSGSYQARPRTPGRDIDLCFQGAITVSRLEL
ncbi:MAG: 5'/3'-nucleotidase SurE [Acidobacteriota bacterium]|nr:5'/3'-nucleotidase SurE [Acidobacteriota bacterium]